MRDYSELRESAMAATPGPWHLMEKGFQRTSTHPSVYATGEELRYIAQCADAMWLAPTPNLANARFIATANPATILALLDELEALRGQVASEVRDGR